MRRIRSKDSAPEMTVRRIVHGLGYRYRLHSAKLAGKPDLVFSRHRKVIFVHGCFWHGHDDCIDGHTPKTRTGYWGPKLRRNRERDATNQAAIRAQGWEVLVIWECETTASEQLVDRLLDFLGPL